MENLKLRKIVANLFETGLMEVDDIIKINDNYPDAIDRAKEICNEIGVQMNFGILIRALTEIVKDYIDYSQLNNEISYKIETLSSGEVIDICDELETFINSIINIFLFINFKNKLINKFLLISLFPNNNIFLLFILFLFNLL